MRSTPELERGANSSMLIGRSGFKWRKFGAEIPLQDKEGDENKSPRALWATKAHEPSCRIYGQSPSNRLACSPADLDPVAGVWQLADLMPFRQTRGHCRGMGKWRLFARSANQHP